MARRWRHRDGAARDCFSHPPAVEARFCVGDRAQLRGGRVLALWPTASKQAEAWKQKSDRSSRPLMLGTRRATGARPAARCSRRAKRRSRRLACGPTGDTSQEIPPSQQPTLSERRERPAGGAVKSCAGVTRRARRRDRDRVASGAVSARANPLRVIGRSPVGCSSSEVGLCG